MLYLVSATLKHYEDQGRQKEDLPLIRWVVRDALMADPAFQAYLAKSRELGAHQSQECRILKSTSFSPL